MKDGQAILIFPYTVTQRNGTMYCNLEEENGERKRGVDVPQSRPSYPCIDWRTRFGTKMLLRERAQGVHTDNTEFVEDLIPNLYSDPFAYKFKIIRADGTEWRFRSSFRKQIEAIFRQSAGDGRRHNCLQGFDNVAVTSEVVVEL